MSGRYRMDAALCACAQIPVFLLLSICVWIERKFMLFKCFQFIRVCVCVFVHSLVKFSSLNHLHAYPVLLLLLLLALLLLLLSFFAFTSLFGAHICLINSNNHYIAAFIYKMPLSHSPGRSIVLSFTRLPSVYTINTQRYWILTHIH